MERIIEGRNRMIDISFSTVALSIVLTLLAVPILILLHRLYYPIVLTYPWGEAIHNRNTGSQGQDPISKKKR